MMLAMINVRIFINILRSRCLNFIRKIYRRRYAVVHMDGNLRRPPAVGVTEGAPGMNGECAPESGHTGGAYIGVWCRTGDVRPLYDLHCYYIAGRYVRNYTHIA